jgi:SSS family solute:Na+ symporter
VQLVIEQFLPSWFGIFVLMAVVAAALSTVGTQLLVTGIFFSRDIMSKLVKRQIKDTDLISWTRWSLIVVVIASLALAQMRPVEMGLFLTQLSSPGLTQWLPLLVGGLFWRGATKEGAIVSLVASIIVLVVAMNYKPITFGYPAVVIATVVNLVLYVGVSLMTKPASTETLKLYFDDVDAYLERENAAAAAKKA